MNIRQALEKCLNNWKNISKLDFCLLNNDFQPFVATSDRKLPALSRLDEFAENNTTCISTKTVSFYKIHETSSPELFSYILLIWGNPDQISLIGELAVCQVESLLEAYAQKNNKNLFFQRLLLGEIPSVDLHNQAKKMHINEQVNRVILLVEMQDTQNEHAHSTIRNMFSSKSHDYIITMDASSIVIAHELSTDEQLSAVQELATILVDMISSEAMIPAKVSFSNIVKSLTDLSNAYKEARTAMEIGNIFYPDVAAYSYNRLGIGRLIYQLPISICELFLNEIYQQESLDSLDGETLNIIRTFFENNLNLSETSRNLYVHRNSLVYRFEKIQRKYGLDLRSFEDALTFKISMMVADYIRHLNNTQ